MELKEQTAIDRPRQVSIDLLECIAILSVLIYHSTLYSGDILNDPSSLHYAEYLFSTLLSPCVPLFFFANGFLLFSRELDLKKHILKTIRLAALCIIWGLGKIVILMPIENEFLSPDEIVTALWKWKYGWIHSLWFVGALVCIYVLFPVLKVTYDNNRKVFYYFVIACAVLTFGNVLLNEGRIIFSTLVMHKAAKIQGVNYFNMFNPFRGIYGYAFVYFCVGGCFYQIQDRILHIAPGKRNAAAVLGMLICSLGLFGVGLCCSKASKEMWDVVWNGYDTIFTFFNVIFIYILCLDLKKDIIIVRVISCNTLGIYFMHEIIIHLTQNQIKQYDALCNVPFTVLYAVIIMMISLVIALIMKKIPLIRQLVS